MWRGGSSNQQRRTPSPEASNFVLRVTLADTGGGGDVSVAFRSKSRGRADLRVGDEVVQQPHARRRQH
eukprot:6205031-Pleurochrysis_carterae.AAC.4